MLTSFGRQARHAISGARSSSSSSITPKRPTINTLQAIRTEFPVFASLHYIPLFLCALATSICSHSIHLSYCSLRVIGGSLPRSPWSTGSARCWWPSWVCLCCLASPPHRTVLGWRSAALPVAHPSGLVSRFPTPARTGPCVAITAATLLIAFYSVAARRPHPVGILATPHGELAFTDPNLYQEDIWIQQHTHPSEYFYEPLSQDAYFYLDLRNPTPLSSIENNGYTTPGQLAEVIRGLEQHQVRYILWNPQALDRLPDFSECL